jgi:hypothetical protein
MAQLLDAYFHLTGSQALLPVLVSIMGWFWATRKLGMVETPARRYILYHHHRSTRNIMKVIGEYTSAHMDNSMLGRVREPTSGHLGYRLLTVSNQYTGDRPVCYLCVNYRAVVSCSTYIYILVCPMDTFFLFNNPNWRGKPNKYYHPLDSTSQYLSPRRTVRNLVDVSRSAYSTVGPKSGDNPTVHTDFASHPHLTGGF